MATHQLVALDAQPRRDLEVIRRIREELDHCYAEMARFHEMEPTEVMRKVSAFHARFAEVRSTLVRASSNVLASMRTKEVDPFLDACKFQFEVHSRLGTFRKQEWEMAR